MSMDMTAPCPMGSTVVPSWELLTAAAKIQRQKVHALGMAGTWSARCGTGGHTDRHGKLDMWNTHSVHCHSFLFPHPGRFMPRYSESMGGLAENPYWLWQLALLGPCFLAQGWQLLSGAAFPCGSDSFAWLTNSLHTGQEGLPSVWATVAKSGLLLSNKRDSD